MAKTLKKNVKSAAEKNFLTRTQALRKLQLKLDEFRRLCILKGIFPKEPTKYFKGANKTYYATKDIKFLSNERLIRKFKEIKSYQKKITKAKMKDQKFDMRKLIENKPTYNLNDIIKQRYPTFNDALHDLDDALCLLAIFSILPKYNLLKISAENVYKSQRLLREFYFYMTVTQSIKRGFISVKGIYISAEMYEHTITFLNPFNHPQKLTYDVDYEIMGDFLELYTALMQFVNFKLFKDVELEYPLPDENADSPFFGFNSLEIKKFQEKITKKRKEKFQEQINTSDVNVDSDEWKKIMKKHDDQQRIKTLFENLVFYISREVPKEIFAMVIANCGGTFADDSDNSAYKEDDKRITHYIVDRPLEGLKMVKNKEYVQPQWVFDCLNKGALLPVADYAPGKTLPAHLSPFYEVNEKGEYVYQNDEEDEELNISKDKPEITKEDKELREMMLSNNKKKLLKKIREEALKKKKQKIKVK